MEEQTDGLQEAPPRATADPRNSNGMSDKQVPHPPNGLSIKIPRPEDEEAQASSHLPSPLPTPSTLQAAVSAAAPSTNSDSLPTILSDEDDVSSDASSPPTRHDRNGPSDSSSLSDSSPSEATTTLEDGKEVIGGSHDTQTQNASDKNHEGVRRLSAAEMKHLTGSRQSLPFAVLPDNVKGAVQGQGQGRSRRLSASQLQAIRQSILASRVIEDDAVDDGGLRGTSPSRRTRGSRTLSTPPTSRNGRSQQVSPRRNSTNPTSGKPMFNLRSLPSTPIVNLKPFAHTGAQKRDTPLPTPATTAAGLAPLIPVPPISLPTHLQLELAAQAPSPLYIQRPEGIDTPYESSAVKMERLKNVILLPPFLERTLTFGALACLDSWLYTFTILPLRFLIAMGVLAQWWGHVVAKEIRWITGFVWYGLGRLWNRGRGGAGRRASESTQSTPIEERPGAATGRSCMNGQFDGTASLRRPQATQVGIESLRGNPAPHTKRQRSTAFRHRRTKSRPSNLSVYNKADLLQGLIIIFSSMAMMKLDGSRMYHFIRAQSDIKLYVIFNVLEVGDRLLGAIGQDILECLFSSETLSRNSSGRSRVLHPLGMFVLALAYNVAHAVALYFQCITLNVAVNSYSNALLTLLMSNQFVEVKSTVFKRFERDNLFQLTCADIVERFQLWIMLLIIGMRNVVEVGGLSVPGAWGAGDGDGVGGGGGGGNMPSSTQPLHSPTILPHSFTVLPSWLRSGEVLSPFLIVLGSEMFVDTIKHAYVTKFNNIKPKFYSRIEDILCKDYYTNAFTTPSLTRRLGLPVLPLSCLFIRASFQTYHTLLATRLSPPLPPSPHTSLAEQHPASPTSPAVTAALERFDALIRDALGRSVYGDPLSATTSGRLRRGLRPWYDWTRDDAIALVTMLVFFFLVFLVLLMVKLVLGMALLHYSRRRYARMRGREAAVARGEAEEESYRAEGKRSGGYGAVEVGEGRSRWLNVDKAEGLKRVAKGAGSREGELERVERYEMVAKRIW